MRKEEFFYDSRDNESRIHAVRYMPESENLVGVIQIIHGMAEYVERYEEMARFFTDRNFVVVGEDHLGHGKSVGENGTKGYFCRQDPATVVVRDSHRLKKMIQEMYPGVPYIIIGHSMGSFILRNYMCRYGSGIDGAVILGTGMQPGWLLALSKTVAAIQKLFLGEKHVSHFIDRGAFGAYNKKIKDPRTDVDWLTRETDRVDAYFADPDCGFVFTVNGFRTLFELISRVRRSSNLKQIPEDLPVLMLSGQDDPVGEYGAAVRRAYASLEKAGVRNITMKLYPEDRHELMNETDRVQVMEDIYEWINKILSQKESE